MKDIDDIIISDDEFERMTLYGSVLNHKEDLKRAKILGYNNPGVYIQQNTVVRTKYKHTIGSNIVIAFFCYINGDVTIEDRVLIGPGCVITAGHHKFDPATGWFSARTEGDGDDSIRIGYGSWLCAHVTITAGVKIGRANLICS